MKRPIADAKRALEEDVIPSANEYVTKQARAELAAAEAKAKQYADRYCAESEAEIAAIRDAYLHELTETRDEFTALDAQGRDARISTAEYAQRVRELSERQRQAEGAKRQAEELAEELDTIEKDPIAWMDALTARSPRLMLDFSW